MNIFVRLIFIYSCPNNRVVASIQESLTTVLSVLMVIYLYFSARSDLLRLLRILRNNQTSLKSVLLRITRFCWSFLIFECNLFYFETLNDSIWLFRRSDVDRAVLSVLNTCVYLLWEAINITVSISECSVRLRRLISNIKLVYCFWISRLDRSYFW